MPKFHDAAIRPPRGQWHYPIGGAFVQEYSEAAIHARLKQWQQNNGTFVSDQATSDQLWAYYCSREPNRCGPDYVPPAADSAEAAALPTVARELNPRIYGPWLWNMLAFEAVRFDKDSFLHLCNRMLVLIDCPDCHNEWREILAGDSPHNLSSSVEAAQWALKQHNRVNRKLGKQQWTWAMFTAEYGNPR